MKKEFTVVGRSSWLSMAQVGIFREKVQAHFPGTDINVVTKGTQGDRERSTPLHLLEGKDLFTKEVQDALRSGEADFAVHSLKDVGSADFFDNSHHVVIDRDDPRDVAIFNDDVLRKLSQGDEVIIGTSSPRRAQMAVAFLQRALPHHAGIGIKVVAVPVRGNVDVRLQKLTDGQYDGIILAVAGLNRLLRYGPSAVAVRKLLEGKRRMVLPLFECPPAAGQGAVVVETNKENSEAAALLRALNDPQLSAAVHRERRYAERYGYGCSRAFGAFHLDTPYTSFSYASGSDQAGEAFTEWSFDAGITDMEGKRLFSAMDHKGAFFIHRSLSNEPDGTKKVLFVANGKAVHTDQLIRTLQEKRVWTAGTKTWLALAEQGIWVEGCADGLGLEALLPVLQGPLSGIAPADMQIITHEAAAASWTAEGWNAVGTYRLVPKKDVALQEAVRKADMLFWISYRQYELYRNDVRPDARHACLPGRTAALFAAAGVEPVVFPDLNAFEQWQRTHMPAPEGA